MVATACALLGLCPVALISHAQLGPQADAASASTANTPAQAVPDTLASSAAAEPAETLPEVRVQGRAPAPALVRSDALRATTTLSGRAIEARQADAVFQLMDEVAGVGVQGGPRASGMSFNVRGYTDNEDVRVQLDGITKGFEKYRFGGTFIEPDLLKAIEVRRGAQIESGAGALGGTVSASTRDAADLLRPGQQWGARARIGTASHNDEQHHFAAAYGRPTPDTDWVLAQSRRSGQDMKLPDGSRLPLSSLDAGSSLAKLGWQASDALRLQLSWIRYHDQGLQPYDTTGGAPGAFGQVQRRIDDDTLSLQARWQDPDSGLQARAVLGHSQTRVRDHMEKGWSTFSTLAAVDDDVDHRHETAELHLVLPLARSQPPDDAAEAPLNSAPAASGSDWRLSLNLGLQQGNSHRTAQRVTGSAALNLSQYPGGTNPAQPPGSKDSEGAYAQLDWRVGRWQLLPGLRWDEVRTQVEGPNAQLLRSAGQSDSLTVRKHSPSATVAFEVLPEHWSLFTTWAQSFRPALLDEAFSRGGWGACNNLNLLRASDGYVPGYARTARVAPSTGLCSSHYQPERSRSVQAGTHVQWPEPLGPGTRWVAKLTAFNDHTAQLLESLMAEPGGSGRLIQPGHEHRWGLELESSLDLGAHSLRLSAHRMEGRTFNGLSEHPLLTVPADRLHLAWHHRLGWGEVGLRWQQVWARRYFTDNTLRSTARQPGHRLIGMNLSWRATHWLNVDVAADNLANTPHQLDNGQGGPGTQGPGRQLRLALSARY